MEVMEEYRKDQGHWVHVLHQNHIDHIDIYGGPLE
jgi:hypothetical protein